MESEPGMVRARGRRARTENHFRVAEPKPKTADGRAPAAASKKGSKF